MNKRLHHVGIVVASVDALGDTLGPTVLCFDDVIQKVRVRFVGDPSTTLIELVEPTGNESIARFLANGGGPHHIAFEVRDLNSAWNEMRAQKAVPIGKPWVGFEGRLLAFMKTAGGPLTELVGPLPSS